MGDWISTWYFPLSARPLCLCLPFLWLRLVKRTNMSKRKKKKNDIKWIGGGGDEQLWADVEIERKLEKDLSQFERKWNLRRKKFELNWSGNWLYTRFCKCIKHYCLVPVDQMIILLLSRKTSCDGPANNFLIKLMVMKSGAFTPYLGTHQPNLRDHLK